MIGKVQSGKTSNFISITALAFDNNYDIVIVLGGTKKPLVKQNRDRIKEYFATSKDDLVLDTTDFKDQINAQNVGYKNGQNPGDAHDDLLIRPIDREKPQQR